MVSRSRPTVVATLPRLGLGNAKETQEEYIGARDYPDRRLFGRL